MLDLAIELVLPRAYVACFVEWESGAAATLLARMADEAMGATPVWCGDMGGLDARWLRGVVRILCAGLPCQPYSAAGKRGGTGDARSYGEDRSGPLPQTIRLIEESRPAVVLFENVPAFVRGLRTPDGELCYPFRDFGQELSGMGYEILDPLFLSAGDVGASHERERVFVLAYDPSQRGECRAVGESARWIHSSYAEWSGDRLADAGIRQFPQPGRGTKGRDGIRPASSLLGEPNSECEQQPHDAAGPVARGDARGSIGGTGCGFHGDASPGVGQADASSAGRQGREWGGAFGERDREEASRPAPEFCSPCVFAPGPVSDDWPAIIADYPHLAPAIEPGLRLLVDGVAYVVDESRADQLRCVGNGVVALQAAVAFGVLLDRLGRRVA